MWMFLAGCVVGTFIGVFVVALCQAGKRYDEDAGLDG